MYKCVIFPSTLLLKSPIKEILIVLKKEEWKEGKKNEEWYFFIKVGTLGLSKLLQTTAHPASGDP